MTSDQFLTYAQWAGYATLFFAVVTIITWIFKLGFRFRMVGVTSFTGVLAAGLFALSLGLYSRPSIPGAVRFNRVFDTGSAQVVITVPNPITAEQLDATLRQAAIDLYSPGRLGANDGKLLIRARTVLHPKPGVSQPLFIGEVQRSLARREDPEMIININSANLAQVPKPKPTA